MQISFFKISKFLLLLPLFGVAIVTPSTLFPFIVGKYVWFRVTVDLAFIFFLLHVLLRNDYVFLKNRISFLIKNPIVISISIFVVAFLLSCFFGIDPMYSFWSNFERGEGGLQILHFWIYFVLLLILFNEEKDWHRLLWCAIIGGLLMSFYGLFAGLGSQGFIGATFSEPGFRFQGSIGNPAYVATFALFLVFYSLFIFISKYKMKFKEGGFLPLIFSFIFLVVFFSAATRGAFVGFLVALFAVLSYIALSYKKYRMKFIVAGVFILVLVSVLVFFRNTNFIKSIPGSRIFDISIRAQTFEHRAIMWKVAIDGFKERPIFGWGPENFLTVFDRHFNTKYFVPKDGFGAWFDRAHSIYFDYLVGTGAVGFLSYISIFIVFFITLFRKSIFLFKNNNNKNNHNFPQILENALFFAMPLSYLVQGLVLFDVSIIYLNLFVFFALVAYKLTNINPKLQAPKNK